MRPKRGFRGSGLAGPCFGMAGAVLVLHPMAHISH